MSQYVEVNDGVPTMIDAALVDHRKRLKWMMDAIVDEKGWEVGVNFTDDLSKNENVKIMKAKVTIVGDVDNCLQMMYEMDIKLPNGVIIKMDFIEASIMEYKIDGFSYSRENALSIWLEECMKRGY